MKPTGITQALTLSMSLRLRNRSMLRALIERLWLSRIQSFQRRAQRKVFKNRTSSILE
jgi:hypothetical protein